MDPCRALQRRLGPGAGHAHLWAPHREALDGDNTSVGYDGVGVGNSFGKTVMQKTVEDGIGNCGVTDPSMPVFDGNRCLCHLTTRFVGAAGTAAVCAELAVYVQD
jgi:hypothetical protein